jgi:YidC/Oxa1 family membrane protein insertase
VISSIVIDQNDVFAKKQLNQLDVHRGWFKPRMFGADDRYFIHAMIDDHHHFAQRAYYKLEERNHLFSVVEGPTVTEKTSWTLSFYFGPKELSALGAVDTRLEKTLDYSGVLSFLAKLLLYILNWLYTFVHNYGVAIILLTLLIQICLLPVSLRNSEEKFKKQNAEYQRELAFIEQRFAGNPEKLLAERTALIRKKGLPGFGCLLPILLQMPIFFALSRVLSSSFELYQAPFLWISDLSARDPYFILPVLVIIFMLLNDTSGNPQQRMTKIAVAFAFGAATATFAAGLTLYILIGRILGFVQTKMMHFFKLV